MASSEEVSPNCSKPEVEDDQPVRTEVPDFRIFHNPSWRMDLLTPVHTRFLKALILTPLPANDFEEYDTQRLTFLHFAVSSLDILGTLEALSPNEKTNLIDWIYSLQVSSNSECPGFQGSTTFKLRSEADSHVPTYVNSSHITMTLSALVSLIILGDDLSRIDRKTILRGVSRLQNSDGSFSASLGCSENDMRFAYSAVAVCYILNDYSIVNIPKLLEFIKNSFSYEGAFSSGNGTEGHAAFTYCAVASLVLLQELNNVLDEEQLKRLKQWCVRRQACGFNGRPNKDEDTCYTFWVGATLDMLSSLDLIGQEESIDFVLHNQNPIRGGIGKSNNQFTDPLHTFLGIAGLSLLKYKSLNELHPSLTMTKKSATKLQSIQKTWNYL